MINIFGLLKLYLILAIFQQSHYSIKGYLKYFLRNFLYYNLFPICLSFIYYLNDSLLIKVSTLIILTTFMLLHYMIKPRLKFTKRIIRLLLYSLVYYIILCFTIYLNLIFEFLIIFIFYLENLLENKLNRKYLIKAKNKIKNSNSIVIGITGSAGKTTVKNIFNTVLSSYFSTTMTPSSYNTPLGIAKFINKTNTNIYEYIVLEFGASKKGDIKELKDLYKIDICVVTDISYMHMDGFKTIEDITKEKMSICKNTKLSILNFENKYIREYDLSNINYISYGINHGDYQARNIKESSFDFYYKDNFIKHINYNLVGDFQVLNILAILSYIHYLGLDITKCVRTLNVLKPVKNRLEIKEYKNRVLIDDSFNSNLNGFKAALKLTRNYEGLKVLITPFIVDLGIYEEKIIKEVTIEIVKYIDIVILVGIRKTRKIYEELKQYNIMTFSTYSFKEAYKLYLHIGKNEKTVCLIENDLPEIYRKGFLF